jgi:hypothetical protein
MQGKCSHLFVFGATYVYQPLKSVILVYNLLVRLPAVAVHRMSARGSLHRLQGDPPLRQGRLHDGTAPTLGLMRVIFCRRDDRCCPALCGEMHPAAVK